MSALSLLAGLMLGMATSHPLVTAAERLHEQRLGAACDVLVAYAMDDPGLTDADRARLRLISSGGTGLGPRPLIRSAAEVREPALRSLLGAADALYQLGQFAGAKEVLEMARDPEPSNQADRVQLLLRQGLMAMPREADARLFFQDALMMDRKAKLPDYAESKTKAVLENVRRKLPPPQLLPPPTPERPLATPIEATSRPPDPLEAPRGVGLITGASGLTLLAGGAAATLVAGLAFQSAEQNRDAGNTAAEIRAINAGRAAQWTAGGLLGAGALTLGAGAFLSFNPKAGVWLGGAAGPGKGAVTVGRSF